MSLDGYYSVFRGCVCVHVVDVLQDGGLFVRTKYVPLCHKEILDGYVIVNSGSTDGCCYVVVGQVSVYGVCVSTNP